MDDGSIGVEGAEDVELGNKGEVSMLDELPTPPYVKRIGTSSLESLSFILHMNSFHLCFIHFHLIIGYVRCNCDVGVPENSRRYEPCPRRIRCGKIWVLTYDEIFMPKQKKKQIEKEMDDSEAESQVGGPSVVGDDGNDDEDTVTSSMVSNKKREKDLQQMKEKMGVILPLVLRFISLNQCAHTAKVFCISMCIYAYMLYQYIYIYIYIYIYVCV